MQFLLHIYIYLDSCKVSETEDWLATTEDLYQIEDVASSNPHFRDHDSGWTWWSSFIASTCAFSIEPISTVEEMKEHIIKPFNVIIHVAAQQF